MVRTYENNYFLLRTKLGYLREQFYVFYQKTKILAHPTKKYKFFFIFTKTITSNFFYIYLKTGISKILLYTKTDIFKNSFKTLSRKKSCMAINKKGTVAKST